MSLIICICSRLVIGVKRQFSGAFCGIQDINTIVVEVGTFHPRYNCLPGLVALPVVPGMDHL